jgi:hypothetical protein
MRAIWPRLTPTQWVVMLGTAAAAAAALEELVRWAGR